MNFFNPNEKKFLNGGLVKVRVLPPFQTKGMTTDSVSQLTKHLQEKMQHEFDLLNSEIHLDEKYLNKSLSGDELSLNGTSTSEDLNNLLESSLEDNNLNENEKSLIHNFSMENKILNDDNNKSINDDEHNKKIS